MAYLGLLKFGIRPRELMEMDPQERAFVIAAVLCYVKSRKAEADKLSEKRR